ncbi:allophanate hydrolase subunit 1 [Actinomadura sp. KC216]|uniref:5-oxoprolinase subunit B family protein n=1 Tax=Actinomadura sp. KC216 TaxID=2530370 RepID=UPI001043C46E|nr:allophanate hydrolase subunit 1 [Actinomadura sp. KC216]TDB91092.1 allophanate hydrolase subunit 1 [Actinomadura sp. KC216]
MNHDPVICAARPVGDRAVLLDLDGPESVRRIHADLTRHPVEGIADVVPGARTLLLIAEQGRSRALTTAVQRARKPMSTVATQLTERTVRLPVRYDGADLAEVAARCGMSIEEVIARHSRRTYTTAFLGLVPGFAYLTGLDPALHLPRRDSPRTRVPAGSLAMASEYTGVYPSSSPGGWHLLGTTDSALWDVERRPPALLTPGTTVQFDPIR